jgi:DNA-binding transcriptional regulator YhcF (GntR family)
MKTSLLYEKISEDIKKDILSGKFIPGDKIYSVSELRKLHNVSHITAMRVYKELSKKNFIEQRRGRGYFVKKDSEEPSFTNKGVVGLLIRPLREYQYNDNFFNDVNFGIQDECCLRRINYLSTYSVQPLNSYNMSEQIFNDIVLAAEKMADSVDGFLFDPRIPDLVIEKIMQQTGKTGILINRQSELKINTVVPPNKTGIMKLLELAQKMGYNKYILCRPGTRESNFIEQYEAFESFVFENKIDNKVVIDRTSIDSAESSLKQLFKEVNPEKGIKPFIVVSVGQSARLFCDELIKGGIEFGQNVGLASIENTGYLTRNVPKIMTLQNFSSELGRIAVRVLLEQLDPVSSIPPKAHSPEASVILGDTI